MARCCGGENSATEGMAQDLITMEKCVSVIGNPNFNGYLKAAYLRFLGEVWLNTFRKVIASFQCFFDLLKITSKDIKSINKETEVVAKDQIEYYVEFTKVLCIFFAPEQKNTVSSENMSIVKELFDTLIESLSSKVLQPIWNDILTAIEILKGSVKDLRDIQEVVDSTKKKIKMEEEIATNRESKNKQEEKKKIQLLKKYVARLKKKNLEIQEVIAIQRIFKNKFAPPQKKRRSKINFVELGPLKFI